MIVLTVVLVAASVSSLFVLARFVLVGTDADVLHDWELGLIERAPSGARRIARALDRRVLGGAMIGAALVVVLVASLFVGWVVSGLDDTRGFARWDVAAAEFGRDNASTASVRALEVATGFGGTVYLVVVMVALGVYFAARRSEPGVAWFLGAVGVGISILNNGLKLIVDRDRPDIAQFAGYAGSSFPSGHSAAAAACWAAVALVVTRRASPAVRRAAGALAVFVAVAVAATRVLLGVHWLTDVVAGVVVGWAWFVVVTLAFGGRALRLGRPLERLAGDVETGDGELR